MLAEACRAAHGAFALRWGGFTEALDGRAVPTGGLGRRKGLVAGPRLGRFAVQIGRLLLANTMTVDSLALRQSSRNEAITSLLAKCRVPRDLDWLKTSRKTLMDRRGEGVAIILERSERLSKKRPVYRVLDESELMLTIYAASALDPPGG